MVLLFIVSMYLMNWFVSMLVFGSIMFVIFLPVYLGTRTLRLAEEIIDDTMVMLNEHTPAVGIKSFLKHPNYLTITMTRRTIKEMKDYYIDTMNGGFYFAKQYKLAPAFLLVGFVVAVMTPNPMSFGVLFMAASLMVTFIILMMGHENYMIDTIGKFDRQLKLLDSWEKTTYDLMHKQSKVMLN